MKAVRLIVAGAGLLTSLSAYGQLLVNGDFEGGTLSGWTVANTVNGVGAPGSVVAVDIDGPGPLGTSPAARFFVGLAAFQANSQGGIEMTQQVPLNGGQSYTLSFDWMAQRAALVNNAEGGIFTFIVDGTAVSTVAAGGLTQNQPVYGHFSANYTPPASASYTVGIRITRPYVSPGDLFQSVDNVALTTVAPPTCYPNCDNSTAAPILNSLDFGCFLSKFAAGDPYANCDNSTAPPVLNALDFGCFLTSFAAGCT